MKINKSYITFNQPTNGKRWNTIDEVPYWSVYCRNNDYFKQHYGQDRLQTPGTYEQIIDYLTSCDYPRSLVAWPRKTQKQLCVYQPQYITNNCRTIDYINKRTGEVMATFNILYTLTDHSYDVSFEVDYTAPSLTKSQLRYLKSRVHRDWIYNDGSFDEELTRMGLGTPRNQCYTKERTCLRQTIK